VGAARGDAAVQMGRIDVGGNRAGTQTAYTAFD
jgi:hypothetical protein